MGRFASIKIDLISAFVWSIILVGVFFLAKEAIGISALICCMYFTFLWFSDSGNRKSPQVLNRKSNTA
jgi:hypothetical protein